jgi:hypothetical protein
MRLADSGGTEIAGNVYPITTMAVTPDPATGYSASEIVQLFRDLDPAAVAQAGSAHTAAGTVLAEIADGLVRHVQVLRESWSGAAASTAAGSFAQLHQTAIGLAQASTQTGSVLSWLGETILPFYKNYSPPGNGIVGDIESLFGHNPQDSAAQAVMARLNNRLSQANAALPPSVSQDLPLSGWQSAPTVAPGAGGGAGAAGAAVGGSGGAGLAGAGVGGVPGTSPGGGPNLSGGAGIAGAGAAGLGGGLPGGGALGGGVPGGASPGPGGVAPSPYVTHLAGVGPPGGPAAPGGGPATGAGAGLGPGGVPGAGNGVPGGIPGRMPTAPGGGGMGVVFGDGGGDGVPGGCAPGGGFGPGGSGAGGAGAPGEEDLAGPGMPGGEDAFSAGLGGTAVGPDGMIGAPGGVLPGGAQASRAGTGAGAAGWQDGTGMPPAGPAAAQRERDRRRQAWLPEDDDLWAPGSAIAPPVIGRLALAGDSGVDVDL